jgi:hypothetical protein
VVAQACLAMSSLAVKTRSDKVHNGNTKKLITKGAINRVIDILAKYPDHEDVQRAAAMCIASLGKT